jgi:tRNA(Ile)-lysidine synthase
MSAWPDLYRPGPAPGHVPEHLLAALASILADIGAEPRRLLVGLSGGADSTALLLALASLAKQLPASLAAVHVNHGSHPRSARWQQHCTALCQQLRLPLQVLQVQADPASGRGLEAEWRQQRYQALAEYLAEGDAFITAHHRDDQAETVLLKLMRGSGLPGLAAMPSWRPLGRAWLLRPLLDVSGETLREYAQQQGAQWIEDPANENPDFDRAFLRQSVLPLLQQRWPAASQLLARSAAQAREALALNDAWAGQLLAQAMGKQQQLCLQALPAAEPAVLKAVLRYWLRQLGAQPLPGARLQELCRQLATASEDAAIEVHWSEHCLRLYQQQLWLCPGAAEQPLGTQPWPLSNTLDLGPAAGQLQLQAATADAQLQTNGWTVRGRRGGERIRCHGQNLAVAEWLRAQQLPPWLRGLVPLLCDQQQQVLAVGDQLFSDHFHDWLKAHGARLQWAPDHPLLSGWRQGLQTAPKPVETPDGLS